MRGVVFAKLALGCVALLFAGGTAGIGLANYTTSGTFDFYRQQSASNWQPQLPPQSVTLQSTEPAFVSDYRYQPRQLAAEDALASLNP